MHPANERRRYSGYMPVKGDLGIETIQAESPYPATSVQYTVRRRYNTITFLPNPHNVDSSSARGVFCEYKVDASTSVVPYAKSCYIAPRYNGACLYTSNYAKFI